MKFPTVGELLDSYCTIEKNYSSGNPLVTENSYYEQFSTRRYNYSPSPDRDKVRLVFLKSVLNDPINKTLIRNGRFIWCKNLSYNGRDKNGLRTISFTVDNGNKKFVVNEGECLCIPSKTYINNNKLFRTKDRTFIAFSSVFSYDKAIRMMAKSAGKSVEYIENITELHNPYRPGALVVPKMGYFYPLIPLGSKSERASDHPCGIVLGKSFLKDMTPNKEFYRIRYGDITYEKVHPIQLEIVNEV